MWRCRTSMETPQDGIETCPFKWRLEWFCRVVWQSVKNIRFTIHGWDLEQAWSRVRPPTAQWIEKDYPGTRPCPRHCSLAERWNKKRETHPSWGLFIVDHGHRYWNLPLCRLIPHHHWRCLHWFRCAWGNDRDYHRCILGHHCVRQGLPVVSGEVPHQSYRRECQDLVGIRKWLSFAQRGICLWVDRLELTDACWEN